MTICPKTFAVALICFISLQLPTVASYDDLKSIGEKYVAFLNEVGQTDTPMTPDKVAELFADNCEKIENGTTLFTSAKDIPGQWMSARKAVGQWTIKPLFMTASSEDNTCTLQIVWKADKLPEHTTMVVLFVDDEGKIIRIREVYNAYKKTLV